MMSDKIKQLENDTIKVIKSSQIITSVANIIKELIENSLDADATVISIKMEKYGYDKLEVKDNGKGIIAEDMKIIAKPYTTSKISSFQDLGNLLWYGFRGEALSSLCFMSDVSIATKTQNEVLGYKYEFNSQGGIIQSIPTALPAGTSVSVTNLFKCTPVRKQYYSNLARRKNDLKKIEELVRAFAIIKPKLYISFVHDGCVIFHKNSVDTVDNALLSVFKDSAKKMRRYFKTCPDASLELWLPDKKYLDDPACSKSSTDRLFIFANERPINFKPIEKLIKKYFCGRAEGSHEKYPIGVVIIKVSGKSIDVNMEPNKSRIKLEKEANIIELLENILIELYDMNDGDSHIPRTLSYGERNLLEKTTKNNQQQSSKSFIPDLHDKCDYLISTHKCLVDKDADYLFGLEHTKLIDEYGINVSSIEKDNLKESPIKVLIRPSTNSDINANTTNSDTNGNKNADFNMTTSIFDIATNSTTNASKQLGNYTSEVDSYKKSEQGQNIRHYGGKNNVNSFINNSNIENVSPKITENGLVPKPSGNLVSTDNVTFDRECWSRGDIRDGGSNIQNVHILSGPKRPVSCLETTNTPIRDGFNRELKNKMSKKPKLNITKSFIEQNTKKHSSAFALFAKDVRHDIFTKNPGVTFTFVAQEISKRWKEADSETRQLYEEKSRQGRNDYVTEIGTNTSLTDISMTSTNSVSNLEKLVAPHTPELTKNAIVVQNTPFVQPWKSKQFRVSFCLQNIKEKCLKQCAEQLKDCVIGRIKSSDDWLYLHDSKIASLNSWRLNEVILYESLMQNYEYNCSSIKEPITINNRVIGELNWNTLISLERINKENVNIYTIIDRRITFNGFKIVIFSNGNNTLSHGEIIGLASLVGIDDLCELLDHISTKCNATLSQCRPVKLKNLIKEESVRRNRSSPKIIHDETLSKKLTIWKELSNYNENNCLHLRPIISPLFDLNAIFEGK